MTKVLVGMSGGIDSSVAAYMLKQQGFDVCGVTMTVWKQGKYTADKAKNSCFSPDKSKDIEKINEICGKIGIRNTVLDISDLYESVVLDNFRSEYLSGHTPNPCVWCNQKIKFGAMVETARSAGIDFDYFATGHYARIEKTGTRYALARAADETKDQSYFLYRLNQRQLSSTLFPLGCFTKKEIREIDAQLGFHDVDQTESQDFYGGHYKDLLDVNPKPGDIVDTDGKVLGHHEGMWNYTIGQRKGLGIAAPYPLYVVALDPEKNTVTVGYEDKTFNSSVGASNIVWGAVEEIQGTIRAKAKIRSTGQPADCTVHIDSNDRLCAVFDQGIKAATKGQSLVVYKDNIILCGGIIDRVDGE